MKEAIEEIKQKIKDNLDTDKYLYRCGLHDAMKIIESHRATRESSSTVTAPLEWEEAIQKSIENMGYKTPEEWSRDAIESGVDLMSRIEKIHNMYKEAALLFMRSHTNHALANFTENHATQIIPGK